MKNYLPLLLLFCIAGCRQAVNDQVAAPPAGNTITNQTTTEESADWMTDFRTFRDAVFQGDRAKAKSFFEFPVMNYNNEIWYLVYMGDSIFTSIDTKIKPFTGQDFDKYFGKLFSRDFIKAVLKIKPEELKEKGLFETTEFRKDDSSTFLMSAKFNKEDNSLSLGLFSNTLIYAEEGDEPFKAEFTVMYEFQVTEKGRLMFKQIRIAG